MRRGLGPCRIAIPLALVLLALAALALCAVGEEIHGDVELDGVVKDKHLDIWGNVTVPHGRTLELRNVTLVFHNEGQDLFGMRVLAGATVHLVDGDGDPLTEWDGTNVTSSGSPWFLTMIDAQALVVESGRVSNLGQHCTDPDLGRLTYTHLSCGNVTIRGSSVDGLTLDVEMVGDRFTIDDSTIVWPSRGSRIYMGTVDIHGSLFRSSKILYVDTENVNIEGSDFVDSPTLFSGTENVRISASSFDAGYLRFYESCRNVTVSDCSFINANGMIYAVYGYFEHLVVSSCTFSANAGGVSARSVSTTIRNCEFYDCPTGIYQYSGRLDVGDCTMIRVKYGVSTLRTYFNVTITNVSFFDCPTCVGLIRPMGDVDLSSCTFLNVSFDAIIAKAHAGLTVADCTFTNTTKTIYFDPEYSTEWYLSLERCVFDGFHEGVTGLGTNVSIDSCVFNGQVSEGYQTHAIWLDRLQYFNTSDLAITNTTISNVSVAVNISGIPLASPRVTMDGVDIRACGVAIAVGNVTNASLHDIDIHEVRVGAYFYAAENLTVRDLRVSKATDGLVAVFCGEVLLEGIHLEDVTGWGIREVQVSGSLWRVDEDIWLRDMSMAMGGTIEVRAELRLTRTELHMAESFYISDGIVVTYPGVLHLEDSSIVGSPYGPFYMMVYLGGTVVTDNATISHCGMPHTDVKRLGPYLQGGGHTLKGLNTIECYYGLIIWNGNIQLEDCDIGSRSTSTYLRGVQMYAVNCSFIGPSLGVSAWDSNVTLSNCLVNSSVIAIRAMESSIDVLDSALKGSIRVLDAESTSVVLEGCAVDSSSTLLNARASTVDLWHCAVAQVWLPGGAVDMSTVRLHDTAHRGNWTVTGYLGAVEYHWHHEVTVVYRWNGSLALGETVRVYPGGGPRKPLVETPFGARGVPEVVWLMGRRVLSHETVELAPFELVVEGNGTRGEATIPGDDTWVGTVILEDVSPPVITVTEPSEGATLGSRQVRLNGRVSELGSGLDLVERSFDTVTWEPIDPAGGAWTTTLEVQDGEHTLRLRASDLDGNIATLEVSFLVDTMPPVVDFSDPANGTVVAADAIAISGFVILGEGSAISRVLVDGETVLIDGGGFFQATVALPFEGRNLFEVLVYDEAGNRGAASLTVVRDTQAPLLSLGHVPTLTNSSELVLEISCGDAHPVTLYLDGRHLAEVDNGSHITRISLAEGRNAFLLTATDMLGNTAQLTLDVVLDTRINGTIASPHDMEVIGRVRFKVRVETDPGAWVRVRALTDWARAGEDGTVVLPVVVRPGRQLLQVDFRDEANNTLVREVSITVRVTADNDASLLMPAAVIALVAAAILLGLLALARRRRPALVVEDPMESKD